MTSSAAQQQRRRELLLLLWLPALLVIFVLTDIVLNPDHNPFLPAPTRPLAYDQMLVAKAVEILGILAFAQVVNSILSYFVLDGIMAHRGRNVPQLLRTVLTLFIYSLASLVILGWVFEVHLIALWTTSGVVGIVLGLALQSMILDIATGMAINLDRTYRLGDWIQVHGIGSDITGQILEISWRTTRLLTDHNLLIVLPNRVLGSAVVTNYWGGANRLCVFEERLHVDAEVPPERVRRVLMAAAKAASLHAGFISEWEPRVFVKEAGPLGAQYEVRYAIVPWAALTPTQAKDTVLRCVFEHLEIAGIRLSVPKQENYEDSRWRQLAPPGTFERKKELLGKVDLFRGLKPDELEMLAGQMRRILCPVGEPLIRRGETGRTMYLVAEGLFEVLLDSQGNGVETRVGEIVPGKVVGEMSLLTGDPRSSTVSPLVESVVYEIDPGMLKALLEKRPELAQLMSEIVAERRLRTSQAIGEAAGGDKSGREASSLAKAILERMSALFGNAFGGRKA